MNVRVWDEGQTGDARIYICLMSWGSRSRRFPRGGEAAVVGSSGSSDKLRRVVRCAAPCSETTTKSGEGWSEGDKDPFSSLKDAFLESGRIRIIAIGY